MKKLVLVPLFAIASAVFGASPAVAQSKTVTITSPAANAAVESVFMLRGTYDDQCDPPKVTVEGTDGGYVSAETNIGQREGNWFVEVDLKKPLVYEGSGESDTIVQPGKVTFSASSFNPTEGEDCGDDTVTVNYGNAGSAAASASATPVTTPTPTDSPSASPLLIVDDDTNEISPALALVIGAVVGGALVGGAEYTAHRYQRRHKKRKK